MKHTNTTSITMNYICSMRTIIALLILTLVSCKKESVLQVPTTHTIRYEVDLDGTAAIWCHGYLDSFKDTITGDFIREITRTIPAGESRSFSCVLNAYGIDDQASYTIRYYVDGNLRNTFDLSNGYSWYAQNEHSWIGSSIVVP